MKPAPPVTRILMCSLEGLTAEISFPGEARGRHIPGGRERPAGYRDANGCVNTLDARPLASRWDCSAVAQSTLTGFLLSGRRGLSPGAPGPGRRGGKQLLPRSL